MQNTNQTPLPLDLAVARDLATTLTRFIEVKGAESPMGKKLHEGVLSDLFNLQCELEDYRPSAEDVAPRTERYIARLEAMLSRVGQIIGLQVVFPIPSDN